MRVLPVALLLALTGLGCAAKNRLGTTTQPACRVTHERLQGLNWIQSSPEHDFACRQVYTAALAVIDGAIADLTWTAALEQREGFERLDRLAVIVDVDETILDSSPFQARLVRRGISYDHSLWQDWVHEARAEALPGARAFVESVKTRGVDVFYVTNRELETPTIRNLRAEIDESITEHEVLCKNERPEWSSDKSSRRAEIAETHRILLLLGDDYNDFAFLGKASPAERVAKAKAHEDRWGSQWFLFPNPLYGSFENAIHDPGLSDKEKLARKYELLVE